MNRKRVLVALGAAWASALQAACSQPSGAQERHRVLARSIFEEGWTRGEVGVFDASIADSVTFHYAGTPRRMSRDEMADIVLRWRAAFPDLRMEVEDLVAEDDRVAARLTLSGTHEGAWRGAAPTGRRATMALMMLLRFEDGRLVELWESDDQLGFQRQLGLIR